MTDLLVTLAWLIGAGIAIALICLGWSVLDRHFAKSRNRDTLTSDGFTEDARK